MLLINKWLASELGGQALRHRAYGERKGAQMLLRTRGLIGKLKKDKEGRGDIRPSVTEEDITWGKDIPEKSLFLFVLVQLCWTNPLIQPPNPASEVWIDRRGLEKSLPLSVNSCPTPTSNKVNSSKGSAHVRERLHPMGVRLRWSTGTQKWKTSIFSFKIYWNVSVLIHTCNTHAHDTHTFCRAIPGALRGSQLHLLEALWKPVNCDRGQTHKLSFLK